MLTGTSPDKEMPHSLLVLASTALLHIQLKKRNHQQCLFSPHLALSHQNPQHKATAMHFSAQGALLLFFFAAFTAIGLCASAVVKMRRVQQAKETTVPNSTVEEPASGWREIKKVLISPLHLGDASQAVEPEVRVAAAETAAKGRREEQGGMTYTPPLWQRRILMGERCEMLKFSGLILYDERGRPLTSNNTNRGMVQQVSESFRSDVETLLNVISSI